MSRRPAVVVSTDTANSYGRMVHNFVSLSARRLGLSSSVILALLRPLQESRHYIRTAYGGSSTYYGGKRNISYRGTWYDNTSSSPFWIIVSSIMIQFMKDSTVCLAFTTSILLIYIILSMAMYVDDNDIFVTSECNHPEADIIAKSQNIVTIWKRILNITGGVVSPTKWSWVFIQFRWTNRKWEYLSGNDLSGTIQLKDESGRMVNLKRIEPGTGVKSLGVVSDRKSVV